MPSFLSQSGSQVRTGQAGSEVQFEPADPPVRYENSQARNPKIPKIPKMSEICPKSTKIGIDRLHPDLKTKFGRFGMVFGVQNPEKRQKKTRKRQKS